ncbi:hypothetical protein OHT93_36670 [Streptomyces sp. NBC_00191]|uniref:hypothetical protein n=1 Tax=Streptomyces sp. NBC_00191 TaxID=2975674 RepID=UPI0032508EEF
MTRSEALKAARCTFREAGAFQALVDRLGVPASGEQSGARTGFTGAWESDAERGFRAQVVAAR